MINITEKTESVNTDNKLLNRVRIEWGKFLNPYEYKILDYILYRYNLSKSNGNTGWNFHIRQIAEETNIIAGQVSKVIKKWNFMEKIGTTKNMNIKFNQTLFEKWIKFKQETIVSNGNNINKIVSQGNGLYPKETMIVSQGNNDCIPGKPISIKEEVLEKSNIKNNSIISNKEKIGNHTETSFKINKLKEDRDYCLKNHLHEKYKETIVEITKLENILKEIPIIKKSGEEEMNVISKMGKEAITSEFDKMFAVN